MKISHRICPGLLLSIPILLVQGCSSVALYPDNWAPVSVQGPSTCAAIVGDYRNRGVEVGDGDSVRESVLQGRFLTNPGSATLATHITIDRNNDDTLTVGHWNGKDRIFDGEIACTDLVPAREFSSFIGLWALGSSKVTEQFFRADDGALIVSTSMETNGVSLLLIPVIDHQGWWSRFDLYKGETEESVPPVPDHTAAFARNRSVLQGKHRAKTRKPSRWRRREL